MTDEQLREQFDAFVYERTVNRNMSGPWPTPTELAWLAWQARDAEVQALRQQNEKLRQAIESWANAMDETRPATYPRFNHETQAWENTATWRDTPGVTTLMTAQQQLLAALAGGETGETE